MSKLICFQDGERKVFVTIHPLTPVLMKRAADKMRRKEGVRITDQSDLIEKMQLSEAMTRQIVDSVEIQTDGTERRPASSIEVDELFYGERVNPRSLLIDEATAYAKERDTEIKKIEGN